MGDHDTDSYQIWLGTIRRYLVATAFLHLLWEFAHMPLYTLWLTGTTAEMVFAAIHCTGGDVLIALSALVVALVIVGNKHWPDQRFFAVYVATFIFGILYTAFSEWLNIVVRASWAYNDSMPVVPFIGMGLSPLLQWIVVPTIAMNWARKRRPSSDASLSTEAHQ